MSAEKLRQQLYDSFANRAHIYRLLFSQLWSELAAQKAAELLGGRFTSAAAKYALLRH